MIANEETLNKRQKAGLKGFYYMQKMSFRTFNPATSCICLSQARSM